jgi:hypothetical protein
MQMQLRLYTCMSVYSNSNRQQNLLLVYMLLAWFMHLSLTVPSQAGLMRKRIASINEAPISPQQRRIAVEPQVSPVHNSWLAEQGLATAEFPLGGGSDMCYQEDAASSAS